MLREELINGLNEQHLSLAQQIRNDNSIRRSSEKAYSFIITGLQILYPTITYNELKISITDDENDASIDAVVFSKTGKIISIFDFKNKNDFGYVDIKLFTSDIRKYLFNPTQSTDELSSQIRKRLKQARRYISAGWKVKIYIVRNGFASKYSTIERLVESLKASFPKIDSYHFLNIKSLTEEYLQIKSKQNTYSWPIKIVSGNSGLGDLEDKIIVKGGIGNKINTMVARLKVADIVKLQKNFVDKGLDLFDANVRDFQKSKNISSKILYSIRLYPSFFHIFHNGLTFSCHDIDKRDAQNYSIENPQIINGCQTVNALYDTYKNKMSDSKFKKATILCRFYVLGADFIEKVCESTNTQVKISLWDLRTNDKIQKIFEKVLYLKGISYKRKKSGRSGKTVAITDLAQWIYSCKFRKPAEAKNKKNKLFDIALENPPYGKIFTEKIKLEVLAMICNIALFVKNKTKKIKKGKRTFEKDADLHFIAALFKLQNKAGTLNIKYKKIHKIIKNAVKRLKKMYGDELNYNQIFTKKEETWSIIEKRLKTLR